MAAQLNIIEISENVPYGFAEHAENRRKLQAGGFTSACAVRAIYERIKASETALKAEFNKKTIKELSIFSLHRGLKKAQLVDMAFESLSDTFIHAFFGCFQWSPFEETKMEAMDRHFLALTDEKILVYNTKLQAKKEEQEKVLNNPETLAEFQQFVDLRGAAALSSEQKSRFDELRAEREQEKKAREMAKRAEVEAVQLEGVTMSLIESRHTKKDVPLWVVQISERVERETYNDLNRKAKMLGGWYSSFNKAAAGFQFYEKEQAEKFMGLQSGNVSRLDHLLQKEEEKKDNSAARLREVAAKLRESAEEQLNADRKVNTARRAGMAASAEASAHSDLYLAETMDNLATAIESGEAKHLNGVKYKTHVETLQGLVRRARDTAGRLAGLNWEQIKALSPQVEHIEHAAFPYPAVWREHILKTAQFLADKKGAMRLAQKMKKYMAIQKDGLIVFRYAPAIADLREMLSHCKDHIFDKWEYQSLANALDDYNRVKDMGLTTEPELRAALREFLKFRGTVRNADPIRKMERDLIGCQIPGYFPTPGAVIDRMMDLADIREGMSVLEPSAGKGSIADSIRAEAPGADLSVVEINCSLRDVLEAKEYKLIGRDFLTDVTSPEFDRVLMNPPFENLQDVAHVQHAFECLNEGGRLVAIMSESPFFRSDRQSVDFRVWLDSVGGWSERLPEGSFLDSDRSTSVNTRIVVINKS